MVGGRGDDVAGTAELSRTGDLDLREPTADLFEHRAHFTLREVCTEAVMDAAPAEGDMRVRLTADVESEGILEDGVVPTFLFERVFVSVREGVALLNPRRVSTPEVRLARAR